MNLQDPGVARRRKFWNDDAAILDTSIMGSRTSFAEIEVVLTTYRHYFRENDKRIICGTFSIN